MISARLNHLQNLRVTCVALVQRLGDEEVGDRISFGDLPDVLLKILIYFKFHTGQMFSMFFPLFTSLLAYLWGIILSRSYLCSK